MIVRKQMTGRIKHDATLEKSVKVRQLKGRALDQQILNK